MNNETMNLINQNEHIKDLEEELSPITNRFKEK